MSHGGNSDTLPQLARRSSATAVSGTLVERIGSYTGSHQWESWEHPANLPLHPPARQPLAGDAAYAPLSQHEEEQHSKLTLMLGECQQ